MVSKRSDSAPGAPRGGAGRGRPKDRDKHDAILEAAKLLFPTQGLAGTSMDGLAAAAGVSKLTLYSHFRSKDELFRQTVIAKCGDYWPEGVFDFETPMPLQTRLLTIGRGFLELVFSEASMSLYRMMVAEAGRETHLGRLFWEAGPERVLTLFSEILARAHAAGELSIPEPRRAAGHFFVLLKGEHHLKCLVGAAVPPPPDVREQHVAGVVELFLFVYAPGSGSYTPSQLP